MDKKEFKKLAKTLVKEHYGVENPLYLGGLAIDCGLFNAVIGDGDHTDVCYMVTITPESEEDHASLICQRFITDTSMSFAIPLVSNEAVVEGAEE